MPALSSIARFYLLPILALGTQLITTSAPAQSTSRPDRDPNALALIQHVLETAGGSDSIAYVRDAVAVATLSTSARVEDDEQRSITIYLRGLDQMRIDSTSPNGSQSFSYDHGIRSSKQRAERAIAIGSEASFISVSRFFPLQHLAAAASNDSYSLTRPETTSDDEDGKPLLHFELKQLSSQAPNTSTQQNPSPGVDYYIDPNTNLIVKVKTLHVGRETAPTAMRQYEIYRFDDYRPEQGRIFCHRITAFLDKRQVSTLTIQTLQINTGISETSFAPLEHSKRED